MKLGRIFTFIIALGCSWFSSANVLDHRYQKAFKVQALSIEQGLSQSVVNSIIQDSDGFIWVATEDGLNQFDGYDFKVFEHDHQNLNSLHDNFVYSLAEEVGYGIWIGTQNGLSFFDPKNQTFKRYRESNKELSTAIVALVYLPTGKTFIGSDNGLYVYDRATDQVSQYKSTENVIIEDEITSLEADGDTLWVSTESCIYSIETQKAITVSHCYGDLGAWLTDKTLKIIRKSENNLWLGTSSGLAKLNLDSNQFESFAGDVAEGRGLTSNFIQDMEFDEDGNLWIATNKGLNVYRKSEGDFTHYLNQVYDQDGLSSNDVMSVFIDNSGLIWLGTYAAGINILDPFRTHFKHIFSKSDLAKFGAANTIHGIVKDKDEFLWVANYGAGLFKLDLMTGELSKPLFKEMQRLFPSYDYPYSLMIDNKNRLWIGTSNGLALIDLSSQKLIELNFSRDGSPFELKDYIFQIYEDHSNGVWVATLTGLFKIEQLTSSNDIAEFSIKDLKIEIPYSFRDRSSRISTMLESKDGNLWVGGPSGLLMYSNNSNKWSHFEYHRDNQNSLSNDDIQVLFEDSRGILWVGTANGLNKIVRRQDDDIYFERITKSQGLPNNNIYGILEDNNKQLWMSTNLGIVKYSSHTDTMQSFRRNDGLSSDEFNTGAYYSDSDGMLYFGSINGVTVVDSKNIVAPPRDKNLVFTSVEVDDRAIDLYQLNHQKPFKLIKELNESTIKISVADLYFNKLGIQSYRYRMLGLDDRWIDLGRNRNFMLAGISEGRYFLEVQSRVENEQWLNNGIRLELIVKANFFQSTTVFYLLGIGSLLLFFLILTLVKRFYLQRISKAENLVKIEEIRIKEIRKENVELKNELELKLHKIDALNSTVDESERILESHQFRDSVTGFYRYQSLEQMFNEKNFDNGESSTRYNFIFILQLSDFTELKAKHGILSVIEIINYVSLEIRKYCPANVNICVINSDSFIIFGNSLINRNLSDALFNLRNKIISSRIPIANHVAVETGVTSTYWEMYPDKIHNIQQLVDVSNLIVAIHEHCNTRRSGQLMRVDLNITIDKIQSMNKDIDIGKLMEGNFFATHIL